MKINYKIKCQEIKNDLIHENEEIIGYEYRQLLDKSSSNHFNINLLQKHINALTFVVDICILKAIDEFNNDIIDTCDSIIV